MGPKAIPCGSYPVLINPSTKTVLRALRRAMVAFIFFVADFESSAQQRNVQGRVINESADCIPGVNVVIKGTTIGRVTNAEGNLEWKAIDSSISSVGELRQKKRTNTSKTNPKSDTIW